MMKISLLFLPLLFFSLEAFADVFIVIADKEEKKKSVSWNLMDWMETKKRFALMDQWLALNTTEEALFEGYIGGDSGSYDYSSLGLIEKKKLTSYQLGMFISLFGLEGAYEDSNEPFKSVSYQASLRILGHYKQSTNLTLSYGLRDRKFDNGAERVKNQYWAGSFTLYLFRFLGGEILYRRYLKAQAVVSESTIKGDLLEMGAFIDIYFLRLTGTLFKERSDWMSKVGVPARVEREGVKFGAKIFF